MKDEIERPVIVLGNPGTGRSAMDAALRIQQASSWQVHLASGPKSVNFEPLDVNIGMPIGFIGKVEMPVIDSVPDNRLFGSTQDLTGEIKMDFTPEEGNSISKLISDWHKSIQAPNPDIPRTTVRVISYSVPWADDISAEAQYLNSNNAFNEGAKLPRGKCRKRWGKKPIKKTDTLLKGCHLTFETDNNETIFEVNT